MAAKKTSRSKTRKTARAKATKKTSVRAGRKAPGFVVKGAAPTATWNIPEVYHTQ